MDPMGQENNSLSEFFQGHLWPVSTSVQLSKNWRGFLATCQCFPLVFAPSFSPKKVYCHLSDCFGASWCIHHFDRNSDLKYCNVVSPKPKAAYHFTFTQIYHRVEGHINHTQNGVCDIGFIIPSLESPNPRANHCFSIELPFGKHPVHFQTHHIQPYDSCKPSYNGNWV